MPCMYLKDYGVQRARWGHHALRNKPALARGEFSAIFEGTRPDTIVKLTVDQSHHAYMTDGLSPDGPHKPVLIDDYGVVGTASTGEDLYLLEVERLAPVRQATDVSRTVKRILRAFNNAPGGMGNELPESVWDERGMTGELAEFFRRLELFAQNYGCRIDAKFGSNYLVRPADGTLVASDPVFDVKVLSAYRKPAYL